MGLLKIREISHKKQQSRLSCVAACLSMVTGIGEDEIVEEMDMDNYEKPFSSEAAVRFLCRKGIHMEVVSGSTELPVMCGRIYLLTCPSSFSLKMAHMVVGLATEHGVRIFDPADNFTEESVYSSSDFTNGNIPIFSYYLLTDCNLQED